MTFRTKPILRKIDTVFNKGISFYTFKENIEKILG